MAKDYYGILGVSQDVDVGEIKKAYRSLAHEWHPDKHQDAETKEKAEEKFKEISEAYSVLADEEKRKNYDATGSPDGVPFRFSTTGDPFDIVSRFGFSFTRSPRQPTAKKGQSIRMEAQLPLVDALFGSKLPINYKTLSGCNNCQGHGGTDFEICSSCNGQGVRIEQRPGMVMQSTCGDCQGQGKSIKTVCSKCNGQTYVEEEKTLRVIIPKGVSNGTTLRMVGKGGRGFNGGEDGDVFVEINVKSPDITKLSDTEQETLRGLLS